MNSAASVLHPADSLLAQLATARRTRQLISSVSREHLPKTLDEAYDVADQLVGELALTPMGYKVGANTSPAQRMLGLSAPLSGRLFAETVFTTPATWPTHGTGIGVEAEWVVRLGRDIGDNDADDEYTLMSSIDALYLGLELNRPSYQDPMGAGGLAIIADNGAHAGLVLGDMRSPGSLSLLQHENVVLRVDGNVVGMRSASAAGVDPLGILAWLARDRTRRGCPLRAGELVATGAIVTQHDLVNGRRVEAGLGDNTELVLTMANSVSDGTRRSEPC